MGRATNPVGLRSEQPVGALRVMFQFLLILPQSGNLQVPSALKGFNHHHHHYHHHRYHYHHHHHHFHQYLHYYHHHHHQEQQNCLPKEAQSDAILRQCTRLWQPFSAALTMLNFAGRGPGRTLEEERLLRARFSEMGSSRVTPWGQASAAHLPSGCLVTEAAGEAPAHGPLPRHLWVGVQQNLWGI